MRHERVGAGAPRRIEQLVDQRVARARGGGIAQRMVEPVAQAPAAHAGGAAVELAEQRRAVVAAQGLADLQVAARRGVERDEVRLGLEPQGRDVREARALRLLRIGEQGGAGGEHARRVLDAEGLQRRGAELLAQQRRASLRIEVPVGDGATRGIAERQALGLLSPRVGQCVGQQHFRRRDARELGGQPRERRLQRAQFAARQHQPGDADRAGPAVDIDRGERGIGLVRQQAGVGDRAGRDDAHHLALDRSLARRRVADLLADRDRLAELDELRQVLLDRTAGTPAMRTGAPAEAPRVVSVMLMSRAARSASA